MKTPSLSRKNVAILASASLLSLLVIALVVSSAIALRVYEGKILPGVRIGGLKVGGLTGNEATLVVQKAVDQMIDAGLEVQLSGERATIALAPGGATDADLIYPLLDVDIATAVNQALETGREGWFGRLFGAMVFPMLQRVDHQPPVTLASARFEDAIRSALPSAEKPGQPTDFAILKPTSEEPTITITPPTAGLVIDFAKAKNELLLDTADLQLETLNLSLVEENDLVTTKEAESLIDDVHAILLAAPFDLEFKNEVDDFTYSLTAENLADWLLPVRDNEQSGQVLVSLDIQKVQPLFEKIRSDIDIRPINAEFEMADNVVTKFVPSHDGQRLDEEGLLRTIEAAFLSQQTTINIPVSITEPDITTAESNSLGINELLGTGYSAYKGSPTNRRANIAHGVSKINGLLVAPGETMSLLAHLRPFTIEDGYLPELVIKGDEIKPEIGGGLCQIGSTVFRAGLNSGLHIAERRNHSLVVSYYNDPSNGKPGTDATIYDPAPDLKITNDTDHHILLQTENSTATSELFFRFWGTSDGRKGYYTPPEVLSWNGYGETVYKETDTLAPGQTKCQEPHPGATTTFDYIIERPDGTKQVVPFRSTYRSLARICLVGKAENVEQN